MLEISIGPGSMVEAEISDHEENWNLGMAEGGIGMTKDAKLEDAEKEASPAAALVMMFETLPEDLQQAVFEIMTDFFNLARAARKDAAEEKTSMALEKFREND
jgi:hypothetical protein